MREVKVLQPRRLLMVLVLAVTMLAGTLPVSMQAAFAKGEATGKTSGSQSFYHDATGYGGVELFYQDAGMTKPAYCLNQKNAYPTGISYSNYDGGAINGISFDDYVGYLSTNPGDSASETYVNAAYSSDNIKKVLYLGYPNDAKGIMAANSLNAKQFQAMTQAAIWYYTDSQSKDIDGHNYIIDYIEKNPTLSVPSSLAVQIWTYNQNMSNRYQNMLVVTSKSQGDEPTPDKPTISTIVSAGGTKASDNGAAKVTVKKGAKVKVTDDVELTKLTPNTSYTLDWSVVNNDNKDVPLDGSETINTSKATEKKTINLGELTMNKVGTFKYSVTLTLKYGEEAIAHNSNFKVNSENFEIKVTDEDTPTPTPSKGKLNTTVTAGGKTASAKAAVKLTADEASGITSITDVIDYEGLVGGATYNVQGRLMDVTDKTKPTEVATSEAKNFKADASGKGSWEIGFSNIQLEAGRTFVVYESATRVTDAKGEAITGGETLKHENDNDKAQTIIVGKEGEEVYTSNLSATKTTDTKTASIGDVIPYTITVTNDGNADAKDVNVTDVMGKYLKYVSDDSKGNNVGQNVNWTVDVPAGSSVEIALDCEVTEGATDKLINKVLIIDSTNPDDIQEYEDSAAVAFAPPEDGNNGSDSSKKSGAGTSSAKRAYASTGDDFNLGLWAILSVISGLALAAGVLRRKENA